MRWSGSLVIAWKCEIKSALFCDFSKFVLPFHASKALCFRSAIVYYILRNELGLQKSIQSLSIMAFDLDLIHLKIFPKVGQNQSFCAHLCLARIDSLASWI